MTGAYDYHNNFAFNPNNEPDFHAPWMYTWTGAPWKTSAVLRAMRTLFTDDAYGMPGNDDLGATSSLLVFAMAGIFEAQPGSATYVVTAPMFEKVEIRPEHGRRISIEAQSADASKLQYVSSVHTDKGELRQSWLSHKDLLRSGTIKVKLSDRPTSWGVDAAPCGRGPGLTPRGGGTSRRGRHPYSGYAARARRSERGPGGSRQAPSGGVGR